MVLLDTHVFIWLVSDQRKLPSKTLDFIMKDKSGIAISTISAFEIAILHKRNRLALPLPPTQYLDEAIKHHQVHEIPVTRPVLLGAAGLPDIHNDPFDRIIIATALLEKIPLISKDRNVHNYPGLQAVWN